MITVGKQEYGSLVNIRYIDYMETADVNFAHSGHRDMDPERRKKRYASLFS